MNGVLFLAVVGVAIGCSQAGLAGGWNEVATNDETIQAIADWAVAEMAMGSLIEIQHAEQQVVAGMNYKLSLLLDVGSGLRSTCNVGVFVGLDGTKELKEPVACTY